jgi:P4 family phage/plasmid primase-like protien
MIPENIRHLKFLKVLRNSKKAFETGWQTNPDLQLNFAQIVPWLEQGNNYGVINGPLSGCAMLDCDDKLYIELFQDNFPKTFSVQSSNENKRHFYVNVTGWPESKTKFSLVDPSKPDDGDAQGGDIRYGNFYVLGPGSIHPDTKKPYIVIDDVPIITITFDELDKIYKPYYQSSMKPLPDTMKRRKSPISILNVLEKYGIKDFRHGRCEGELSCPHPIHGSETGGTNFGINTEKNVWICRRHKVGGGIVHLIALMEGIVECSQVTQHVPDDIREKVLVTAKKKFNVDLYYEMFAPLNDTYNATIFAKENAKKMVFCTTYNKWYTFNKQIWVEDKHNVVRRCSHKIYLKLIQETPTWVPVIEEKDDEDVIKAKEQAIRGWKNHVRSSGENCRLENMVSVATKDMSVSEDMFDKEKDIICLKNGIFNLKTFKLLPFDYKQLITKQANFTYDPEAKCPNWERLMKIIFEGDNQIIEYMQKVLGYCLTADVSKQMFLILHGGGKNGKSTMVDTVKYGMGSYATTLGSSSLLLKKDDAIPNDWAALNKMRFVVAAEIEESRALDTAVVKSFTSDKPMKVRFLNQEFFEMLPTFKVFLETNPLPRIKGDEFGTWRRIKKIPFKYEFKDEDTVLGYAEKFLYPELPGIFNWLVEGLKNADVIVDPPGVVESIKDYREEENHMYEFVERYCKKVDSSLTMGTLTSNFWDYYKNIMDRNKEFKYGKHRIPEMLQGCGIKRERVTVGDHKGKWIYKGLICSVSVGSEYYSSGGDVIKPPEPVEIGFDDLVK